MGGTFEFGVIGEVTLGAKEREGPLAVHVDTLLYLEIVITVGKHDVTEAKNAIRNLNPRWSRYGCCSRRWPVGICGTWGAYSWGNNQGLARNGQWYGPWLGD